MASTNGKTGGPTMAPPAETSSTATDTAGVTAPSQTEEQFASVIQSLDTGSAPTLAPPTAGELAAAGEAAAATWHTNKRIDALWSIDQPRNAFIHVVDLGWRKLYNGRDGAFQALCSLASQARQTNRICHLREEADGMIYEIYLW
ncbi:hypothetical protein EV646_102408 [Kribbella antiqua]|uniref:Uncharacterized protein n=1 Tax=Kribbella antiqua TaxID=2512217 RepID=A0A4R2IXP1_9ACTN|nr:hypothetical protein [Kribbella antiqua]TCO50334.1 hypothetical protein EV646_102408 [Kribbella antiqua]